MGQYLALAAIGVLALVGGVLWWKRRKAQMYDLRYWNVDPPGEAYDDMVDEESGPYCFRCDHPNPPGTNFCQSCGQRIA
jgi:hypothetical protein